MQYQFYQVEFRKTTDAATERMRLRTAKEQHAAALAEANREERDSIPDADDESASRTSVLL